MLLCVCGEGTNNIVDIVIFFLANQHTNNSDRSFLVSLHESDNPLVGLSYLNRNSKLKNVNIFWTFVTFMD